MTQRLNLKRNVERRLKRGHQWVFSNELQEVPKIPAGEVIELFDFNGVSMGKGFYNQASLISVRLLATNEEIDKDFFKNRIEKAYTYRMNFFQEKDSFRLVYGESDFLPGLVIDKFADNFSLQALSFGIENRLDMIVDALLELFPKTKCIYAKNDSALRNIEGLPAYEKELFGTAEGSFAISENGLNYEISLSSSQKTGYFLDQKINRFELQKLAKGKKVLDLFCNQGGFALNAAKGGAKEVLGVDISESAIEMSKNNANINKLPNCTFEKADVFDFLDKELQNNAKWDMIVIDPPAFAKNKKSIPTAKAAYAKVNKMGMKLLNENGYLVASSCSHHISEEVFLELITYEATKARKNLRMLYRGLQSPCHPILIAMHETQYLKFFIFEVTSM